MNKLFKAVVCVLTVFSMVFIMGCVGLDESDYKMLNGDWDRGDIVVTFTNKDGVFTQVNSGSVWMSYLNSRRIGIGDKKFKNIIKSGNLRWTCQELNTGFTWEDCTIIMSDDGRTITTASVSGSPTFTKVDY
jgi:hypothetical protein